MSIITCAHKINPGNLKALNLLLSYKPKINVRSESGFTPLMYAATEGNKKVVMRLIAAGADLFAKDNYDNTAWKLATNNKHKEIAGIIEQAMRKNRKPKYTFADNSEEIDLEFPDL